MTLPDRIRQALAADHAAVEATPFAMAMIEGKVTATEYAAGLGELFHLHLAVEEALAGATCSAVAAVYRPDAMNRAAAVERDLAALGHALPVAHGPAVARLAAQIESLATATPWALLGPLYVLEGSRMGSMVLVRVLAPALGVGRGPGVGLDYHLDGIGTRPQDWQRFRAALAAAPLTAAQQDDVAAAAVAFMAGLVELYAALPAGAAAAA